ncbi:hypothetical protein FACS1894139_10370 [Planctomycetales bacterium]|nr:hypothetical protein FACS1894108_04890 [Planctomycetales bacterium]GHT05827.1 hypothetical protein FACS1894139_10370 [Planctomycetales bacterium]
MPIPISCPCGMTAKVKESYAGKRVKCPQCGGGVAVPDAAPSLPEPVLERVDNLFNGCRTTVWLDQIQCPHCWEKFPPTDLLAVAEAEELRGDPVLGDDEFLRFPPVHFSLDGIPLDGHGNRCRQLACPRCHLPVPRAFMTTAPTIISLVGAAGSGKSYLLAAMTHSLRRSLPRYFGRGFNDADTVSNLALGEYERRLFRSADNFVLLDKTQQVGGDLYREVIIDEMPYRYPRPFLFALAPMAANTALKPQTLILYDNAGESFQPGEAKREDETVTTHTVNSAAMLFLFDPTQDVDLRRRLNSNDPQLQNTKNVYHQALILNEIALRMKNLLGLKAGQRHRQPLVVVVAKCDIWQNLLPAALTALPVKTGGDGYELDAAELERVSAATRNLLNESCPDVVAAAESAWATVKYVPASATGCSPQRDAATGALGFNPQNIKPIWAEIPLLWAIKMANGK